MEYLDISKLTKAQVRELLDLLQTYKATSDGYVIGYLYQRTRGAVETAIYNLHEDIMFTDEILEKYKGQAAAIWVADQATLLQHHLKGR